MKLEYARNAAAHIMSLVKASPLSRDTLLRRMRSEWKLIDFSCGALRPLPEHVLGGACLAPCTAPVAEELTDSVANASVGEYTGSGASTVMSSSDNHRVNYLGLNEFWLVAQKIKAAYPHCPEIRPLLRLKKEHVDGDADWIVSTMNARCAGLSARQARCIAIAAQQFIGSRTCYRNDVAGYLGVRQHAFGNFCRLLKYCEQLRFFVINDDMVMNGGLIVPLDTG